MIDHCYRVVQRHWKRKERLLVYRMAKVFLYLFYPLYALVTTPKGVDTSSPIIVSLTTFPARIDKVHLVIHTLLRQRRRPAKIQLWLAETQFPDRKLPQKLLRLEKYGLEIRYCDDLRSHKKYYYAMKENPDLTIVTADDDMLYPESWLCKMVETGKRHPEAIVCMLAYQISSDMNGTPIPYNQWPGPVEEVMFPQADLLPIGCEGVLYPPHSLHPDLFDKDFFMTACRNADDLWLKAMSLRQGVAVMPAEPQPFTYVNLLTANRGALNATNVAQNGNDVQLQNILSRYPDLLKRLSVGDPT